MQRLPMPQLMTSLQLVSSTSSNQPTRRGVLL